MGVCSSRLRSCLNSHPAAAAAAALEIARPHSCLVSPVLCAALSVSPPPAPVPSLSPPSPPQTRRSLWSSSSAATWATRCLSA